MTLEQHFNQNVSSNIAWGRNAIITSVLSDVEALTELEETFEIWQDIDLPTLRQLLDNLACLKVVKPADGPVKEAGIHMQVGMMVEDAFMSNLIRWIDAKYEGVDLRALGDQENEPEYQPEPARLLP